MPNSSDLRLPRATLSYRVVIDGVKEGHTVDHVTAKLAEIFARSAEQMHALAAAPRAIVKKRLDYASAQRFQAALERCGCVVTIEPDTTDFSTLVLCHHVSPGPGIAIHAPEAWHASMDGDTFQLLDETSGACLRAVGVKSAALSVREWAGQRMRWLAEDMPYLRQVRAPYRLDGAGWGDRVQGIAADYRGVFPGTGVYSHYLVLCLRSARSLVCLTIHAPVSVYDANEPLYRWLLQHQLDVRDAAPEPMPEPEPLQEPLREPLPEPMQDPVPETVALSPYDEALQRWLRYNEARPSRRARPAEEGTGVKPWRPSPRENVRE